MKYAIDMLFDEPRPSALFSCLIRLCTELSCCKSVHDFQYIIETLYILQSLEISRGSDAIDVLLC